MSGAASGPGAALPAGAAAALPRARLDARSHAASLEALGFDGLQRVCREDAARFVPEPRVAFDPRTDRPVVFSPARADRLAQPGCVVCDDLTCPAVDVVELPPRAGDAKGDADADVAWLTPNLFPNVYPFGAEAPVRGIHLVQWSSRHHDRGLPGAPPSEASALLRQLSRAEEFLLHGADAAHYPDTGNGHHGHVGIIKNKGTRVGGSVAHDHQQILLTNIEPSRPRPTPGLGVELLHGTPAALVVDDIDGLARTLVAPFMSRPLSAFIVPGSSGQPAEADHLHHLHGIVREAVAVALARLTAAIDTLMSAPDATTGARREPARNQVFHTGPGRGPLIELLPYTQPLGGYEHLGLYMCEQTPEVSAGLLRDALPS